jgi:predicted O-linked N-acetylglucosamine transferase (SPINDLY family)
LQSLQKFHPAYDAVLAEILRRDPLGLLLVPEGHAHCRKLLRERFSATAADVAGRICWIPWQTYDDYLRLLAVVDLALVPTQFGGGRTSYDALALGVPVVTLPSPYLRGRITYGLYRAMDVPDCVARTPEEYVDIAVRLGTDAGHRRAVGAKIMAAHGRLYEDLEAVREVEQFLLAAVEQSRCGV